MSTSDETHRFGERVVASGLATRAQVDEAIRAQRSVRGSIGYHLARLGKVSSDAMEAFLEAELEAGRLDPLKPPPGEPGLSVLPVRLAQLYNAYPVALEPHRLVVALPPLHGDAVHVIAEATSRIVEPILMPAARLRQAVEHDYLGAATHAVHHPAAGLSSFLVDDSAAVHPVAPALRTDSVSAEVWLRSILGEAIAQRRRTVEIVSQETLPASRERALRVIALVEELADLPPRGASAERGRFLLEVRGRRPVVEVVRDGWDQPRVTLALSEQRFASDDPDDLFADCDEVMEAVEGLVTESRGLLLLCGPAGGGGRRLAQLLGERLIEVAGGGLSVPASRDDVQVARSLHEALEDDASMVVAEQLPGTRSLERALLVAARAPVFAGLVASDSAATLAWMARQGLGGALKVGLLRGVISVLGVEDACPQCSAVKPVAEALAKRFGRDESLAVRVNAGCDACTSSGQRKTTPALAWTPVAGRPDAEWRFADEEPCRRAQHARGLQGSFDRALAMAAPDGTHEFGAIHTLLNGAP